ncbi:MAG: sensor histidine kinase [Clostridiaceae bacterium]|nr:sensor histidine kinase [Clostridiaceae bacterium]
MKRERYFRDELRKLFIGYAIVPAVLFTLICGLAFVGILLYGKGSGTIEYNKYAAQEVDRVLSGYEKGLKEMVLQPENFTKEADSQAKTAVFQEFYRISNSLGCEADLYLFDRDRNPVLTGRPVLPSYFQIKEGLDWGIFGSMDRKKGETAVRLMESWKSGSMDMAVGRAVYDGDSLLGYLVFTINSSQFQPVLDRSDAQTVVTDRFGWVYLSNSYNFLNSSNQIVKELEHAGRFMLFDGHMYLVSARPAYRGLFRIYAVSDIQNIVVSLSLGSALIITALAAMTAWVLVKSKKVTEKKTEDFYRILDVMEKNRNGDLDDTIRIKSDNEFRIIADTYNETITGLKQQMENNRKMAELVAAAQNRQLESQFNPHFLYNTLENIRYMCRIEPEIASKMILSLSNLLRYSLDNSKEEVTLKEDIDHLENYLTILKYRFNRRFSYEIDVEPRALKCRIPKLVLQPMIENSIKYGFGNQETLRAELKAYIYDGKLIMICRDDGVGIPPAVLSELTALFGQKENKSRHSGLYNIHRRIEILYGHPYGVEIRSTEGHGTTLIVTVPAHMEEM